MAGILTLQTKIASTGVAQRLTSIKGKDLTLTAKSTNTAPIAVTHSSTSSAAVDGTGVAYILEKGTSTVFRSVEDTSSIWVNGTANDVVSGIVSI